jgi:hypothetical protein
MRDIQEIIEELRSHKDFLQAEIFTMQDALDDINNQLYAEYDVAEDYIKREDLTEDDIKHIHNTVEEFINNMYYDGYGPYPVLETMPDVVSRIKRDVAIHKVLSKD